MVPVVLEIRVDTEDDEDWFHREMDLPFLPIEGMNFEIELVGPSSDIKYRRHATFMVKGVTWVERDNKTYVWLEIHDKEERLTISCLSHLTWKKGEKEPWRW